jgi:hypothetical protein
LGYCISGYCISGYGNIGFLHIGLLHIGFLLKGSGGAKYRVFDCRVIDISGFCLVGFLISGYYLLPPNLYLSLQGKNQSD